VRQPMSRADRAKQFMPFAALKGYDEALNRKARIPQARILLAEDAQTELDEKLRRLRPGDEVTALYYSGGEYVSLRGRLRRIDPIGGVLAADGIEIPFEDLLDIAEIE